MTRFRFALTGLLLTCAAFAAPVPEPLVSGWANPLDPDRDCKIRRDSGALIIEMPSGDHDYDPARKRFNAPRLPRDIEDDFEIQVRVRIDCHPSVESTVKGRPAFVGGGFLLILPDAGANTCFRWEYRIAGQGSRADGWAAENGGQANGGWGKRWEDWPFNTKPEHVYLRLERLGDEVYQKISPDGKSWTAIPCRRFIGLPSKLKLCLTACSTSTEPSKVQFDQLKLTRGKRNQR